MENERKVIGAVAGPREGWATVVCDDGSVFVGLDCGGAWPLEVHKGEWHRATPIPGTAAARRAEEAARTEETGL